MAGIREKDSHEKKKMGCQFYAIDHPLFSVFIAVKASKI